MLPCSQSTGAEKPETNVTTNVDQAYILSTSHRNNDEVATERT